MLLNYHLPPKPSALKALNQKTQSPKPSNSKALPKPLTLNPNPFLQEKGPDKKNP